MEKIGVNNIVGLVKYAYESGVGDVILQNIRVV